MIPGRALRTVMFSNLVWLALALAIVLVPSVTAAFKYLQEGMRAPVVEGKDILSGSEISTDQLLAKNNLVIVVFWATWSKRSIDELTQLKEMALQMPDLPVKIVAVNVEGQSVSASIRKTVVNVVKDLDLPFPVIIDDGLDIFYDYGVVAVPSTAVLDTSGVLRYGPAGFSLTTRDLIADSIEVLLGIKQATATTAVRMGYWPKNKASRYYNLALNLFKQRMFERALSNLELSVSDDSGFSAPHNLRGEVFLRLGQVPEALEEFELAVSLDSGSVAAWTGWGRALMRQGDVDGAYDKISAALTLDDSYTPAFLLLGLVLAEQGRTSEALDSLAKARELNERDPEIHFYIGQVLLLADDTAQAAVAYKTALDILYPPY